MRIGIDYRMLASGISVNRGMGRYTQQQLREVLKLDTRNEYVLFCPQQSDLSLILPEIRNAPNVSLAADGISISAKLESLNRPENVLVDAEEFQEWICRQKIDLFHATTPLLLEVSQGNVPNFNVCPLVATFYDLIPLIFSDQYLPPKSLAHDLYLRALHFLLHAKRFIAISNAARHDAVTYLGYPANLINVAYPMADSAFRVLPKLELQSGLQKLRSRAPVPDDFLLTVSHLHYSKNLETLFAAYSRLSPQLRQQLPLVAAFKLTEVEKKQLQQWASKYDIVNNLIITGFVAEDELVALYNQATLVVHPSRYEGFGLPVLEAMSCGAPVLTTTASSLPEVGGEAAVYVGPDDPQAFAEAIEGLWSDPVRREAMGRLGFEQTRKFNGEQLARSTLACYEAASSGPPESGAAADRPCLALWAPLPPQRSGVAIYTAELLQYLAQAYEIEVFVDGGYLPSLQMLSRYPIQHHRAFERRAAAKKFDVILYQLGASTYHLYMYPALQKWPGITMLHDLIWGHVLYFDRMSAGKPEEFRQMVLELEGPVALAEFKAAMNTPPAVAGSRIEDFLGKYYMLKQVVESSLVVAMHMEHARQELALRYDLHKLWAVPFGVDDPRRGLPTGDPVVIRSELGLRPTAFVVGIFGIVDPVKHIELSLQALHDLRENYPDVQMVIVGEAHDPAYQSRLERLVQALGLRECVYFTGHLSPEPATNKIYNQLLLACDVIVSLRFPSRKQMSRTLLHAIAAGKPVITTDLPEWDQFPREFCWRVPADEKARATLTQYLQRLAAEPDLCQRMSASARAYFEREGTLAKMVMGYQQIIQQITGPVNGHSPRTSERPAQPVRRLNHNKVCEIEDFEDSELLQKIKEIFRHETPATPSEFPCSTQSPRYWASAMSVRALDHFGVLHPQAVLLGVGVGTEPISFYLTYYAYQVFATESDTSPGRMSGNLALQKLIAPERFAPYPYEETHLVLQHMDGRILRYPDNLFDGVFSLDALSHFGSLDLAANAAYEMGRVLKPGGVLTLSLRYCLRRPPNGNELPNIILFSSEAIQRYVIEASGLVLVDILQTDLSERTLFSKRDLTHIDDSIPTAMPTEIVTIAQGFVFCLLHLTLQKTASYPVVNNDWACPTPATRMRVQRLNLISSPFQALPFPVVLSRTRSELAVKRVTKLFREGLQVVLNLLGTPRVYRWYAWLIEHLPKSLATRIHAWIITLKLGE